MRYFKVWSLMPSRYPSSHVMIGSLRSLPHPRSCLRYILPQLANLTSESNQRSKERENLDWSSGQDTCLSSSNPQVAGVRFPDREHLFATSSNYLFAQGHKLLALEFSFFIPCTQLLRLFLLHFSHEFDILVLQHFRWPRCFGY